MALGQGREGKKKAEIDFQIELICALYNGKSVSWTLP
jgi:hypothetical protein